MTTTHSDTDFRAAAEELRNLGYAIVRTIGDEDAVNAAVRALGCLVGARAFGSMHLRATDSREWLGRHTESLTDGPTPLRYFALACFVPAQHGATQLYDGIEAAKILTDIYPELRQVRISYQSAHRPEVSDHPLIVEHELHGPVLRFRSACDHNTVLTKPVGLNEDDLYKVVENAVGASLAHVHTWRAGEVLIVDNHRMLHSRAPFMGLRHMLRVRYDDPLHQTVTLAE